MKITILDRNTCRGEDQETKDWLKSCLQYQHTWWKDGPFKKEPQIYTKYMVDRKGLFLAGFIPKIVKIAEVQKKQVEWIDEVKEGFYSKNFSNPSLPGITLRDDQIRLVKNAITNNRGLLKAPTRTGKTVIAAGIISALAEPKTLFIVHTLDLLQQTADEFTKFGFDVGVLGGGKSEWGHDILVSTRQSYVKYIGKLGAEHFDLVIVDEAHHAIKMEGQYGQILTSLQPRFKLGFTATLPEKDEGKLIMEGLIGPMIGEVTQEEAEDLDILAKTKVRICKVTKDPISTDITTFEEAYRELIVMKRSRNKMIMDIAKEYIDDDKTVLIIVRRVAHGFYLEDMFKRFLPNITVPFLCGGMDAEGRVEMKAVKDLISTLRYQANQTYGKKQEEKDNRVAKLEDYLKTLRGLARKIKENSEKRGEFKERLNNREIKCIIATNIWNEGVNIPTLNTIILAGAGKSETQTIQSGSRAFTKSEGKEYGTLVDLFDPNFKAFVGHFGHRISMYCELGWM